MCLGLRKLQLPQVAWLKLKQKWLYIFGGIVNLVTSKINSNYFKKKKALYMEKSKLKAKVAKMWNKSKKKLKYIHCDKLNHNENNCFILHLYKWLTLDKIIILEDKIIKLKKRFNSIS